MYNFPKNTTVACPATPSVNISQPQAYMTWHKHAHRRVFTSNTTQRGWTQQGCDNSLLPVKTNSLVLLSVYNAHTDNWLHNLCSYENLMWTSKYKKPELLPQNILLKFELTIVRSRWAGTHWTSQSMPSLLHRPIASLRDQRTPEEKNIKK